MRSISEIREMIRKLNILEGNAPQYLKETYQGASETLEWVLGERVEEEVISFGE